MTYKTLVPVFTFDAYSKPTRPVDPEIAAAVDDNNVMIRCTRLNAGYNVPGQGYSQDGGQTWTTLWPLFSSPAFDMFSVALHANEGGHSWHMSYTGDHHVFHADRPQDLSGPWYPPLTAVDDVKIVSHDHPRKGITSHWNTYVAAIAWPDFRDGYPDYDTYFDHSGGHSLSADAYAVSATKGGTATFILDAGSKNAGRQYLMLGSISGTFPGTPLPRGKAKLPLNWDLFTNIVIDLLNGPLFQDFMGQLDKSGKSKAVFTMLPVAGVEGLHIAFAYALNNPWNYASNPVQILILP